MSESSLKSIRVHILGREYALRVEEDDESFTREMASFVNARMEQFRDAHPEQAELTTAVITALALAEELHTKDDEDQDDQNDEAEALNETLNRLAHQLDSAVANSS